MEENDISIEQYNELVEANKNLQGELNSLKEITKNITISTNSKPKEEVTVRDIHERQKALKELIGD